MLAELLMEELDNVLRLVGLFCVFDEYPKVSCVPEFIKDESMIFDNFFLIRYNLLL